MKDEKSNFTRLTSGAICGMLMVCASLLFGGASAFGQKPTLPTWAHENGGKPDPGVTTPGPKGSTITKYKDKWTKTTETDNSVPGKPETKETIKDDTGKIREIFKRDPKTGQVTYHFVIWDEANGDKTTYTDIGNVQTKVVEKPNGDKKSYTWKRDPKTNKNDWVEDEDNGHNLAGCSFWELRGNCYVDLGPQSVEYIRESDGFRSRLTLSPEVGLSTGSYRDANGVEHSKIPRLSFLWRESSGYHGIRFEALKGQLGEYESDHNYWVLYQVMSKVRATFNVNGQKITVQSHDGTTYSSPAGQAIDIPKGATILEYIEIDAFGKTLTWSAKQQAADKPNTCGSARETSAL